LYNFDNVSNFHVFAQSIPLLFAQIYRGDVYILGDLYPKKKKMKQWLALLSQFFKALGENRKW